MDEIQFDALTRAIGFQMTRRLTLGALLAGAIGLRDTAEIKAKRKSGTCTPACTECTTCTKGKCTRKNGKKRCKKRTCQPKQEGTPCTVPVGGNCEKGVCACPGNLRNIGGACGCTAGFTQCGTVCTTLETDAAHCGSCGNACAAGETCCSGVCKNLNTDEENCGACEAHCVNIKTCCFGHCEDTGYDAAHCGGCGKACPGNQVCCASECCGPSPTCNIKGLCCLLPGQQCEEHGECCSGVCLPVQVGVPFPQCSA